MATAGSTGSINLTKKASPKVMERFKFASCTEGLFSNDYAWSGVATVQIYSVDDLPLNDYNPELVTGGSRFGNLINIGDTIQEHTIKDNKAFIGAIDETYNTQQLQIKQAGKVLRRQMDNVVIPYVDKYRIRKMAAAGTSGNGNIASATLTTANIVETIMTANAAMSENLVGEGGRVLYMSYGTAIKCKLAAQVVGSGPVDKGSIGEKSIVNGVMGQIDGCQIKLVPAGYLPNNVEFMIVKKGICFAPKKLASYKVHDGSHILDGKIVTGHLLHDCFVPVGREKCIFVVTASGNGSISTVGSGALTVTTGTATVSNSAIASMTIAAGMKTVTVSTLSSGVVTADVTGVAVSDESKLKAVYTPTDGTVELTPLATGSNVTFTVYANGKPGYSTPAPVTITVTAITAS